MKKKAKKATAATVVPRTTTAPKKTRKMTLKERLESRGIRILNEGHLTARIQMEHSNPLLMKMYRDWNSSFFGWQDRQNLQRVLEGQGTDLLPWEAPLMKLCASIINVGTNQKIPAGMEKYEGLFAHFRKHDPDLHEFLLNWFTATYVARLEKILANEEPVHFAELDQVLNHAVDNPATYGVDWSSSYEAGEKLAGQDFSEFPYVILGRDEKTNEPLFVRLFGATLKSSWVGTFIACQVSKYRWYQGALRSVRTTEKIAPYDGARYLKDLGIDTSPTPDTVKTLAARGRRVVQANQEPTYAFSKDHMQVKTFWAWRTLPSRGRVMIDQDGMQLIDPETSRHISSYEDDMDQETEIDLEEFTDLDYAVVDPWVFGFSLTQKLWGRFHIDSITEVNFREDAFDQLVIDKKDKDLILALVKHVDPSKVTDFVDGKGGGCAFLFHGKPGLGKTLTAEAVAETVKRPLYAASVGELGVDVEQLESNLNRVLQLAARWNAVLLLDEADIFLETRSEGDIDRNAMVGTFLRLLEYYNGIIILTSNRVKSIDPAFYSRISFARKYTEHDDATRKEIIQNLLKVNGVELDEEGLTELAKHEVNGRQLKNSIRLARFLAESEEREVTAQDISDIVTRVASFAEDLVGSLDD